MKDQQVLSTELAVPLRLLRGVASNHKKFYMYQRRQIGKKRRLLRIPTGPLREIQQTIKKKLLDPMPLPPSMHGWRRKRSPKTYSREHVAQQVVVNADIQNFFPSVGAGRVYGFWVEAGYDPGAAKLLTLLTTLDNQLPQGSPTSQSLGNQILRGLETRLAGLANQHDLNLGIYGDEVALSGRRRTARLKGLVLKIIEQEGFAANPGKIKVMPRDQRQELTGVVVNKKSSPGRATYRELRAVLHNCIRFGLESQNRQANPKFKEHLQGRIAQLQYLNPRLGHQLLADFQLIQWPESDRRGGPNATR